MPWSYLACATYEACAMFFSKFTLSIIFIIFIFKAKTSKSILVTVIMVTLSVTLVTLSANEKKIKEWICRKRLRILVLQATQRTFGRSLENSRDKYFWTTESLENTQRRDCLESLKKSFQKWTGCRHSSMISDIPSMVGNIPTMIDRYENCMNWSEWF